MEKIPEFIFLVLFFSPINYNFIVTMLIIWKILS